MVYGYPRTIKTRRMVECTVCVSWTYRSQIDSTRCSGHTHSLKHHEGPPTPRTIEQRLLVQVVPGFFNSAITTLRV